MLSTCANIVEVAIAAVAGVTSYETVENCDRFVSGSWCNVGARSAVYIFAHTVVLQTLPRHHAVKLQPSNPSESVYRRSEKSAKPDDRSLGGTKPMYSCCSQRRQTAAASIRLPCKHYGERGSKTPVLRRSQLHRRRVSRLCRYSIPLCGIVRRAACEGGSGSSSSSQKRSRGLSAGDTSVCIQVGDTITGKPYTSQ